MKNEKNRKLHGSVLLTVVVVMSLLIVFLFGTLTLATAANNRAHVNYSSAQTGVTSRMVAQSAVEAMDVSQPYRQVIGAISSTVPGPLSVNVTVGNAGTFNSGALGDIAPVQVEYAGTKKVYDYEKKEWKDNTILKFTSSVTMGGVESKSSAYVLKLTNATGGGGGGGGSGFRTTGQATVNCQTSLYGGSYINLPKENYKYYDEVLADGTIRKPDFSTVSRIELNNSGAVAEAPLYINNNVYIQNWSGFIFPEKSSGITIWGNLEYDNNVNSASSCQYEAKDGIDFTNIKFNEIPYIYVDGELQYGAGLKAGNVNKPFPLNLFCGSIVSKNANGASNIDCAANIYCMDEGKTSHIEAMNYGDSSKLYSWTDSVINQAVSSVAQPNKMSIFSKGNLVLKNIEVDGDVSCEGFCEINGKVVIHGNLYVGDKLTVNGELYVDGEIICKTCAGEDKIKKGTPTLSEKKKVIKPGYEKVDTIKNKKVVNPVEIANKEIEYFGFDPQYYLVLDENGVPTSASYLDEEGNPVTYDRVDILGNPLLSSEILYYRWPTNLTYEQISGILAAFESTKVAVGLTEDVNYKQQLWRAYYDAVSALFTASGEVPVVYNAANVPDGKFTYKVKGYYDKNDPIELDKYYTTEPTTEDYSYYDPDTGLPTTKDAKKEGEEYKTLPIWSIATGGYVDSGVETDLDYVYFTKVDHQQVDETAALKEAEYYPAYAEREVILGLKEVDNPEGNGKLSVNDTRVVSTIDYLYNNDPNNSLNPYAESVSGLPSEFTDKHAGLTTYDLNSGYQQLITAASNQYVSSIGGQNNDLYNIELATYTETTQNSDIEGVYINKNCRLSGKYANGGPKNIVFDPGTSNMLIAFDNFTVDSGVNIIIDDSKGGKVTFFIEDGGELNLNGEAIYATISYMNLLKHFNGKELQLVSKYITDPVTSTSYKDPKYIKKDAGGNPIPDISEDITDGSYTWSKERFVPGFDIRSGSGAKLNVTNFKFLTANIVSNGLDCKLSACSDPLFLPSAFYYNGTDIFKPLTNGTTNIKQLIFGCVNTESATLPNAAQVIFADTGGGGGGPIPATGDFKYTVLYYDEY